MNADVRFYRVITIGADSVLGSYRVTKHKNKVAASTVASEYDSYRFHRLRVLETSLAIKICRDESILGLVLVLRISNFVVPKMKTISTDRKCIYVYAVE